MMSVWQDVRYAVLHRVMLNRKWRPARQLSAHSAPGVVGDVRRIHPLGGDQSNRAELRGDGRG
jgi:hypothetical protein